MATACRARAGFPKPVSTSRRTFCAVAMTPMRLSSGARTGSAADCPIASSTTRWPASLWRFIPAVCGPAIASPVHANMPETMIAMLATASLGATCSLVLARFRHPGRRRPLRADRAEGPVRRRRLPLRRQALRLPGQAAGDRRGAAELSARDRALHTAVPRSTGCRTARLLGRFHRRGRSRRRSSSRGCRSIIRSTSCTRRARPGVPKCIVHGAGGTLLQHLKEHVLHTDVKRDDRLFYFTTCGWMMWNWLVSALAVGATLVLYDGSPLHPGPQCAVRLRGRRSA